MVPEFLSSSQIGYIMGLADKNAVEYESPKTNGAVTYERENRDRWVYNWNSDPVLLKIAGDVAAQLDVSVGDLEAGMQLFAHYEGGQTFFHADTLGNNGNDYRSYTVLLYLNDDYTGSYIDFPYQDLRIKPTKGVLISYPLGVDENTQDLRFSHSASLIAKGTKYMAIFTVRTKIYKPLAASLQTEIPVSTSIVERLKNEVMQFPGVIDPETCRRMIDELNGMQVWQQSHIYDGSETKQSDFRTSESIGEGQMPPLVRDVIVNQLNPLLQRTLSDAGDVDIRRFEQWQALRYKPGGKFDYHTDTGLATHKENERLYTVIIGLQAPVRGGETHMQSGDIRIRTEAGKMVVWRNTLENSQPRLDRMHAGLPVEEGEKIILVNWIREYVPS